MVNISLDAAAEYRFCSIPRPKQEERLETRPGVIFDDVLLKKYQDFCIQQQWNGKLKTKIGGHTCVLSNNLTPLSQYFGTMLQVENKITGTQHGEVCSADILFSVVAREEQWDTMPLVVVSLDFGLKPSYMLAISGRC